MDSDYGSMKSAKQSSNSSKCYGISPANKYSLGVTLKLNSNLKTKLVFLERRDVANLRNGIESPRNKSQEKSSLSEDFIKKLSSSNSDEKLKHKERDHSQSSISSTTSVVRMVRGDSIEGLHTFNLKKYIS